MSAHGGQAGPVRFRIPDYRLKFRVYPSPTSRLFAKVYIFDTFCAMREAVRLIDIMLPESRRWRVVDRRRLGGQVTRVTHAERRGRILSGEFALVYLARPGLRMGIITHESVHVAAAWLHRRGVTAIGLRDEDKPQRGDSLEETLCQATDRIARHIVQRCRDAGALD